MTSQVHDLLQEATEWRLFGLLFEYPTQAWRANLESLLPDLHRTDLQALAQGALQQTSEGLHSALFGPGGTVPVREVAHRGGVQFGYLMAELSAYYEAFGFQLETQEAVDHFSVQLSFIAFLRMKQVAAILAGQQDHEQITSEAAESFIKEHLAVQTQPILDALQNFAPEFLVEAGRLILQRTGPSPSSSYPLSASVAGFEDSEEMACGPSPAADDLIQLQHE